MKIKVIFDDDGLYKAFTKNSWGERTVICQDTDYKIVSAEAKKHGWKPVVRDGEELCDN